MVHAASYGVGRKLNNAPNISDPLPNLREGCAESSLLLWLKSKPLAYFTLH